MDLEKIEGLVKIIEDSSLNEFTYKDKDVKITMSKLDHPPVRPCCQKVKRGPPLYGHRGGGGRSTAVIGEPAIGQGCHTADTDRVVSARSQYLVHWENQKIKAMRSEEKGCSRCLQGCCIRGSPVSILYRRKQALARLI